MVCDVTLNELLRNLKEAKCEYDRHLVGSTPAEDATSSLGSAYEKDESEDVPSYVISAHARAIFAVREHLIRIGNERAADELLRYSRHRPSDVEGRSRSLELLERLI